MSPSSKPSGFRVQNREEVAGLSFDGQRRDSLLPSGGPLLPADQQRPIGNELAACGQVSDKSLAAIRSRAFGNVAHLRCRN